MSENIRNAWKSQAWLDTQQVSKRQIQLKQKRRPLNLSLEVSAKRNDPTSIEWWNCWTSWKEKNKWHGINGGDLRKFNAPSPDPDRSQTNRNESDGYDKNNNVNINSCTCVIPMHLTATRTWPKWWQVQFPGWTSFKQLNPEATQDDNIAISVRSVHNWTEDSLYICRMKLTSCLISLLRNCKSPVHSDVPNWRNDWAL